MGVGSEGWGCTLGCDVIFRVGGYENVPSPSVLTKLERQRVCGRVLLSGSHLLGRSSSFSAVTD